MVSKLVRLEVSSVLQGCLIQPPHRGSVILNTDDVKFLWKLVWLMGPHSALLEMGTVQTVREVYGSKLAGAQYGNGSGYSFLTGKQKELDHPGYTILDCFLWPQPSSVIFGYDIRCGTHLCYEIVYTLSELVHVNVRESEGSLWWVLVYTLELYCKQWVCRWGKGEEGLGSLTVLLHFQVARGQHAERYGKGVGC